MLDFLHVSEDWATVLSNLLYVVSIGLVDILNVLCFDLVHGHSPEVMQSLANTLLLRLEIGIADVLSLSTER